MTSIPTILVLLGATGDLMGRKIVPALFDLYRKGNLPKPTYIIGFSRKYFTNEQFRLYLISLIKSGQSEDIRAFVNHFYYQHGDFNEIDAYKNLANTIHSINAHVQICSHKLFYLAVPPKYYANIFQLLHQSGTLIKCADGEGWTRVIVEKPFGNDASTAQKLDDQLSKLFSEEQVYRIDHYLAKEMLQNILSFRFANNILEDSWNNKMVEKIEIRLWESLGVEDRVQFYDGVGALRDVGQNHLLQMLALITMDNPVKMTAQSIREQREKMLSQLTTPTNSDIKVGTYRSQHLGYKDIVGVSKDSKTETYFKIKLQINTPRWKGVPIIIESGKRMKSVRKEIVVTFKHPNSCYCPPESAHQHNKVIFQLEPKEKIIIQFLAKKPGHTFAVETRNFQFSLHRRHYKDQYVGEYEKLLLDVFMGDQTLFIGGQEIKEMWRVIDPIVEAWAENLVPLNTYKPNTNQASKLAETF